MKSLSGFTVCLIATLCMPAVSAQNNSPTERRTVQAELEDTIRTKKAKIGDIVKGHTVTALILSPDQTIPVGTTIFGHVRRVENSNGKSLASISFEEAQVNKKKIPVTLTIQAAMMATGEPQQQSSAESVQVSQQTIHEQPLQGAAVSVLAVGDAAAQKENQGSYKNSVSPAGAVQSKIAAHTGSVIGLPGVTLEVDDGPQHASTFNSARSDLELKKGLQLILLAN